MEGEEKNLISTEMRNIFFCSSVICVYFIILFLDNEFKTVGYSFGNIMGIPCFS